MLFNTKSRKVTRMLALFGAGVSLALVGHGSSVRADNTERASSTAADTTQQVAIKPLFEYPAHQLPNTWIGTGDFTHPRLSDTHKMITGEDITGVRSQYILSTRSEGRKDNSEEGTIKSEPFQIPAGDALTFHCAGGSDPQHLRITLVDASGKELRAITGNGSYDFVPVIWQGEDVTGKDIQLCLSDQTWASHGFVAAADFTLVRQRDLAKLFVPGRQAQIEQLLSQLKAKYNAPGIWGATWDARIGDISASYYDGFSSVEENRKASRDTLVQFGSISKSITGFLACILIHKINPSTGKPYLSFDDTIGGVLPEMSDAVGTHTELLNATVRQLLTHTAGLSNGPFYFKFDAKKVNDPSELRKVYVRTLLGKDPVGLPGQKTSYAPGCEIVGVMLEKRTGKTLEQLLKDEIFTPFGLISCQLGEPNIKNTSANTQWGYTEAPDNHSYKNTSNDMRNSEPVGIVLACGAMYGTTEDLAKYFGCLYIGLRQGYGTIPREAFYDAFTAPINEPWKYTLSGMQILSDGVFSKEGASDRANSVATLDVVSGRVAVISGNFILTKTFLDDARDIDRLLMK